MEDLAGIRNDTAADKRGAHRRQEPVVGGARGGAKRCATTENSTFAGPGELAHGSRRGSGPSETIRTLRVALSFRPGGATRIVSEYRLDPFEGPGQDGGLRERRQLRWRRGGLRGTT